jgi:hypothetical protein
LISSNLREKTQSSRGKLTGLDSRREGEAYDAADGDDRLGAKKSNWRPVGATTQPRAGITVYLLNGGLLESAQQMAAHESARTTKLYDRRNPLDQVERIVL